MEQPRITTMKSIIIMLAMAIAALAFARARAGVDPTHDAIRAAALDYVDGWYTGDAERMKRAVHPALAKRILRTDESTGRHYLDEMGASQLINGAAKGYGRETPLEEQVRNIQVLDVYGNAATVKAEMRGWIDYMHLAKFGDRWVIVNVLWEQKPRD